MKRVPWSLAFFTLMASCGPEEPVEPVSYETLPPQAALSRISMALRGVRPDVADLDAVASQPDLLTTYAQEYAASDAFVSTMKDMYAEALLMRSVGLLLPNVGDLASERKAAIRWSLSEETLNIIGEVVRNDEPFGTIVSTDWSVLDAVGAKIWDHHTYDTGAGGTQIVEFTDGRPAAGVLSTGSFLVRHESNGQNYHRGRANVIADTLLCASFSDRDIPITGDVDLSDNEAVANALWTKPECVGCHTTLDPLAANFWGFRARLTSFQVSEAEKKDCDPNLQLQFSCYPVAMYKGTGASTGWENNDLRPPGYWGAHVEDLAEVGQHISEDPRFALCAAKTFASYLTQTSINALDDATIASYQERFLESGQSAQELAVAIVTSPSFLAESVSGDGETPISGIQVVRPEQLERMMEQWTGFRLEYGVLNNNFGNIRVMVDDDLGFRAMSGGVDGSTVTSPTLTPTPVKLLAFATYAEETAGYIVAADFDKPKAQRRLLDQVESGESDESTIRVQLAGLHLQIYGRTVDEQDDAVTSLYTLWSATASTSTPKTAWEMVLTAMFQSPDVLFY